jgi:fructokinase
VILFQGPEGTPDFIPYVQQIVALYRTNLSEILSIKRYSYHICIKQKLPSNFKKAQEAHDLGCKLSIDLNYAKKAVEKSKKRSYKNYCQFNPLIKNK